MRGGAARHRVRSRGIDDVGREFKRCAIEPEDLFCAGDVLGSECQAMGSCGVGVVGGGEADMGAQYDESGRAAVGASLVQDGFERIEVLADLARVDHVPSIRAET